MVEGGIIVKLSEKRLGDLPAGRQEVAEVPRRGTGGVSKID